MLSVPEIQKALDEVCPKYGAIKWTLFGSYAHGTATEDSDIDVLVEFKEKPQSYHEWMRISNELGERLGKTIDIVAAPITRGNIFKLDGNGVPMFVTSEERTVRLIPVVARSIAKMKKKLEAVPKDEFLLTNCWAIQYAWILLGSPTR